MFSRQLLEGGRKKRQRERIKNRPACEVQGK